MTKKIGQLKVARCKAEIHLVFNNIDYIYTFYYAGGEKADPALSKKLQIIIDYSRIFTYEVANPAESNLIDNLKLFKPDWNRRYLEQYLRESYRGNNYSGDLTDADQKALKTAVNLLLDDVLPFFCDGRTA